MGDIELSAFLRCIVHFQVIPRSFFEVSGGNRHTSLELLYFFVPVVFFVGKIEKCQKTMGVSLSTFVTFCNCIVLYCHGSVFFCWSDLAVLFGKVLEGYNHAGDAADIP